MKLRGRCIWITGAARRIGRAIALACAQEGAHIILHYRDSKTEAEATADEIRKMGGHVTPVCADLCQVADVVRATQDVLATTPVTDLIHNASVFFPTPLNTLTESDWDLTLNSNLKGPLFLTQALLPSLRQKSGGHIVFLGDENTPSPAVRFIPYAVSKEALATLTNGFKKTYPDLCVTLLRIGPTLPPEDSDIQSPPVTSTVDTVVSRVIATLTSPKD